METNNTMAELAETVKIVGSGYKEGYHKPYQYWVNLKLPRHESWVKEFSSREELDNFLFDNFNKIDKSYISKYSRSESGKETTGLHFGVFQNVLNRIFGQREWLGSGVKDKSYDTQNCGYINSYYGSEKHEDIGIEVFGTSSYGDAYYGYSGSIRFKFI